MPGNGRVPFTEKRQNPTELGVLRKGVGKKKVHKVTFPGTRFENAS